MTVERTHYLLRFIPAWKETPKIGEPQFLQHLYHSDINDLGYFFSGHDLSKSAKVHSEDELGIYTFNPNSGSLDANLVEVLEKGEINRDGIEGNIGCFLGTVLGYRVRYSWKAGR